MIQTNTEDRLLPTRDTHEVYESTYEEPDEKFINGRLKDYRELLLPLLPEDKMGRILDIGCGYGLFLDTCRSAGYRNLEGVDLIEKFTHYARDHYKLERIYTNDLIEHLRSVPDSSISAITAINVVEHIKKERVQAMFELIAQKLKPGGVFIAELPNADSIHGIHTLYSDLTHEFAYTKFLLINLLTLAGFENIRVIPNRVRKNLIIRILQKILAKVISGDDKLMFSGNLIVSARRVGKTSNANQDI